MWLVSWWVCGCSASALMTPSSVPRGPSLRCRTLPHTHTNGGSTPPPRTSDSVCAHTYTETNESQRVREGRLCYRALPCLRAHGGSDRGSAPQWLTPHGHGIQTLEPILYDRSACVSDLLVGPCEAQVPVLSAAPHHPPHLTTHTTHTHQVTAAQERAQHL